MRLPDVGTGLLGLGAGLWLAYAGHDLGLGDMNEPGSGFILFWIGIIMAGLSAALAGSGLVGSRASAGAAPESGAESGTAFGEHWRKVPVVLVYLIRSEEHTSELQSLMRNSYAVFCLKKKKTNQP